jgi:hypothetical protein
LIAGPALLLIASVLLLVLWRNSLTRKAELELAAIRVAREPVTFADLRSWGPEFPGGDNAAFLLQEAAGHLVLPNQVLRATLGLMRLEWPKSNEPLNPKFRTFLFEVVQRNRKALDLLHASAKHTKSRHLMDRQMDPRLAYAGALAPLGTAVEVLQWEALLAIEERNEERTVRALETLLALASFLGQEPALAGQQPRLAALNAALQMLERMLQQPSFGELHFPAIAERLAVAERESGPALVRAFIGERCLHLDQLQNPGQVLVATPGPWMMSPAERLRTHVLNATAELTKLRERELIGFLRSMNRSINQARKVASEGAIKPGPREIPDSTAAYGSMQLFFEDAIYQNVDVIAMLRAAQLALAIEQFRTVNGGALPENLNRLKPQFLSELPIDPYTRGSMRFKPRGNGYIIYSVGRDGSDDDAAEPQRRRGIHRPIPAHDLVFRAER